MNASSRPGEGLVGVWLSRRFDLAFCDTSGRSLILTMTPVAAESAAKAVAGGDKAVATAGGGVGAGRRLDGAPGSDALGERGGFAGRTVAKALPAASSISRWWRRRLTSAGGHELSNRRRRFGFLLDFAGDGGGAGSGSAGGSGSGQGGDLGLVDSGVVGAGMVETHSAVWQAQDDGSPGPGRGLTANTTAERAAAGVGPVRGLTAEEAADPDSISIELATSRALVAAGGAVRIVWTDDDTSTLLVDGVMASLEAAAPCPHTPHALCACVAAATPATPLETAAGGGGGGGSGSGGRRAAARGGSAAAAAASLAACGLVAGRAASAAAGGLEAARSITEAPPVALATAPVVVMAARGPRAVLRLVPTGGDVVDAARHVARRVRAVTFPAQLDAAVRGGYEALRAVPHAIGLPAVAPPEDKRLSRKLYDIMSVNTGHGWSTPDRVPHALQWLWDSCFHALGMNLVNHTAAWEQLKGLLNCQQPDGFIPHFCSDGKPGSTITQPPLLAWAVWDNYLFARDRRRLEWALPKLTKLLDWLAAHRSRDNGSTYFYVHGFESGMDNSPRFDGGGLGGWLGAAARRWSSDPGAGLCEACTPHLVSADLTALVAREMAHVARVLKELGRQQEAERWYERSRKVAAAMDAAAWSPERHVYGDVVRSGLLGGGRGVSQMVTVAGLLPLLAGRLPPAHLKGLLAHLQDPNSFATPVPLPSVALACQRHDAAALSAAGAYTAASAASAAADMWRGPMWVNTNYLVAVGLREQRCALCSKLANWIVNSTITEVRRWYGGPGTALGTVFEYYDSQGVLAPSRLARKGILGVGGVRDYHWTAALTLRMLAESAALASVAPTAGAGSTAAAAAAGSGSGGDGLEEDLERGYGVGEYDRVPAWVPGRPLWADG
ncbi:hypothetical protein HYH03_006443 [Edaphochlamys debaryana]|uniref:Mannosylglycerate hydrolase MGH1-like glycoside hydrolase domain-containing protein n=1 Tax=Edaphochlamys debaryana TaxID=47281 RepID=A0A835YDF0_9CHLO|nr:hypothetical protein HYH03_006443 [Edaphochlamys debaryana]|eukprot:KAG2495499.1 hypothetical protein HYH03_006443 [Edaphochlamys debaryana]